MKKFVTTVRSNGTTSVDFRTTVPDYDLAQDMRQELERLSEIARSSANARIQSVEATESTIVIVYTFGAVKIYHWVADTE